MIYSLSIKLGMLAATMGLVFWIGWKLPESGSSAVPAASPPAGTIPGPMSPASIASATEAVPTRTPVPKAASNDLGQHKLDLNKATVESLEQLPGIGSVLAQRVVAHRRSVGGFRRIDDLLEVKGIGAKKFERIRSLVTVTPPGGAQPVKRTT